MDEVPEPGLLIAAFGLVDLLRLSLVAETFLLRSVNRNLETPLHLACEFGQSCFVEEYLKWFPEGLHIDAQDKWSGSTAFYRAMKCEKETSIQSPCCSDMALILTKE
jgi:hypothetical protein